MVQTQDTVKIQDYKNGNKSISFINSSLNALGKIF